MDSNYPMWAYHFFRINEFNLKKKFTLKENIEGIDFRKVFS